MSNETVKAVEVWTSRFEQTPLPEGTLTGNACHVAVEKLRRACQNGVISWETGERALNELEKQVNKHSTPLAGRLRYIFTHGASNSELTGSELSV